MGATADNVRKLRNIFDITQRELADIAGVTENAVSKWENGYSEPRMGAVERMAAHFRISKSHLIEDGGMDLIDPVTKAPRTGATLPGFHPIGSGGDATVPLVKLGKVHAGDISAEETVHAHVDVPVSVLRAHPRGFALTVEGDCMSRVIPEGADVIVDPDTEPRNGSVVVVETQDYEAVMRRWFKGNSTLLLTADSFTDHDDIVVSGDTPIRVIGTVVWYQAPPGWA